MKSAKRNINIHYVSIMLLVLAFVAMAFSMKERYHMNVCVQQQTQVEQNRRKCEEESRSLIVGSDYLTAEVWRFIAVQDLEHLDNYWNEVEIARNRDKAIQNLMDLQLNEREEELVYAAKEGSDNLIEKEAWAMRLVLDSMGMEPQEMPSKVASVTYQNQEEFLSPEEKVKTATEYIFGEEYSAHKEEINKNLKDFQNVLSERKNQELVAAIEKTQKASYLVEAYNLVVLLLLIIFVAVFYILVLWPFHQYSDILGRLESSEQSSAPPLTPKGSKEMRQFAVVFNQLYGDWKSQNSRLEELNSIDFLTGISNRAALDRYIRNDLEHGRKNLGVMMMDIDSFKVFNDNFGHLAGDRILIEIGRCLSEVVSKDMGMVGRLGGEEFIVVLSHTTSSKIDSVANDILERVRNINMNQVGVPVTDMRVTVSIGSTIWDGSKESDPRKLVHQADLALYQAKKNGKNQHIMFMPNDYSFIRLQNIQAHDAEVEAEMYGALKHGQFIPFYQPKYDVMTGNIVGAEALARWNHPQKGILAPDYFIPLFENNGFVILVDLYIFETVCRTIRTWLDEGKKVVPIACNFSRLHFTTDTLACKLKTIIDQYNLSPSYLEVEVTESTLIDSNEYIIGELEKLQKMGFSIAIDDFGSGYSSLGVLQEFPANVLKIDRSFLQRDLSDQRNVMIISGIIYIAKVLHLQVVCEGVENEEQVELLRKVECNIAQGYYYSRPVDRNKMEQLLNCEI